MELLNLRLGLALTSLGIFFAKYLEALVEQGSVGWITWERQPRNISMARSLNANYVEIISKHKGVRRYLECTIKTLSVLREKRFRFVFVQNPSIVLAAFSVLMKYFFKYRLAIDAHNSGVFPLEGRYAVLNYLNGVVLSLADLVIVTNENLKASVNNTVICCPDPLPNVASSLAPIENDILVVCSWSEDEPIEEYLEVAKNLQDKVFSFTGNYSKYYKGSVDIKVSDNVRLLGFIEEAEYYAYLAGAKLVIDLTKRDDCLVCGAYEAIAYEKPVIVTENNSNKAVFGKGVLYSRCIANDLSLVITDFFNSGEEGSEVVLAFKESYIKANTMKINEILKFIEDA